MNPADLHDIRELAGQIIALMAISNAVFLFIGFFVGVCIKAPLERILYSRLYRRHRKLIEIVRNPNSSHQNINRQVRK